MYDCCFNNYSNLIKSFSKSSESLLSVDHGTNLVPELIGLKKHDVHWLSFIISHFSLPITSQANEFN